MRVFVPLSPGALREAAASGVLRGPLRGHAVTVALREAWRALETEQEPDEEELEYAVTVAAARDAVELAETALRVVAALELEAVRDVAGDDVSTVEVDDVPWREIAAMLVDAPEAVAAVAAAREGGSEVALEACLDHELGWYAVQEVEQVLALLERQEGAQQKP